MDQLTPSHSMGWSSMLGAILLIPVVTASPVHQTSEPYEEYPLNALDCRRPTKIQTGLISDVCGKHDEPGDDKKVVENVLLLQESETQVLKATRCKKYYYRMLMYCGSFSHMKLVEAPDVHDPVPFPEEDCEMVRNGLYKREDGTTVPIQQGQVLRYKYLKHGKITFSQTNVKCEGATVYVHGEQHNGVLEYISVEVEVQEVSVEISPDQIQDLDANIKLPYDCGQDYKCTVGQTAYILDRPQHHCPLYNIRSMSMEKIQVTTNKGVENALISHEHKIMLIVRKPYKVNRQCEALHIVYHTNYDKIKVAYEKSLTNDIDSVVARLIPSVLDMDLELKVVDEYLAYKLESTISNEVNSVSQNLCQMNRHNLKSAEVSPFHPNSLIRISGEIITEVKCTPVTVHARIGDKRSDSCNADALPVWAGNQPVWIQSVTRLIIEESEIQHISCNSQFLPAFHTNDGVILHAAPQVEKIKVQLAHVGESYIHHNSDVHETFEEDLLYSSEEISKFNALIHFSRSKNNLVASLTDKYCSRPKSCGSHQPPSGGSSFSLQNLEDQVIQAISIWARIKQYANEYGGLCGLVLMAITLTSWSYRLLTMCRLYFGHRTTATEAVQLTFNLNDMARQRILQEAQREHQSTGNRSQNQHEEHEDYMEMANFSRNTGVNQSTPITRRSRSYFPAPRDPLLALEHTA